MSVVAVEMARPRRPGCSRSSVGDVHVRGTRSMATQGVSLTLRGCVVRNRGRNEGVESESGGLRVAEGVEVELDPKTTTRAALTGHGHSHAASSTSMSTDLI